MTDPLTSQAMPANRHGGLFGVHEENGFEFGVRSVAVRLRSIWSSSAMATEQKRQRKQSRNRGGRLRLPGAVDAGMIGAGEREREREK